MAVQVHNDSVKGSDLSFLMNLFNLDERNYNYYDSQFRYYRQIDLESSKFPIVFIETDEYDIPVKNVRVQATMSIIDNNTGVNKITDPISFTSRISIERRGESSADFPKMSYNIETQDELGNNLDVELMGMPADNDWVLFSSFADKSLIRTELTYLLFARMDHYAPRTRYCELIYNGQYMGLYYFMEKIKRGKDRVDVAKRDTTNPEEGGFIFKYDKPTRKAIQFVYPKKDEVTTKEKTYITNFVKEFENVLKSDKFLDLEEGYRKYVSGKSLVDYVIINELSKNCDAYLFSTYFHKNKNSKDGRIKYGPPWDYDIAYGDAVFQEGNLTSKWQFEFNTDLQIKLLFRDTTLTHALSRRWWTLRSNLLSNENIMHLIDSLCTDIYESRVLNFQVWPIIDKYLFYPPYLSVSYDNEIQITKDWITKRLKWIDENIDNIYYPLDISAPTFAYSTTAIDLYPNPFNNYLKLRLIGESGKYDISIAGMDGKIYLKKSVNCIEGQINNITFSGDELSLPASGMYFIIVSHNGRTVQAEKIIKQ